MSAIGGGTPMPTARKSQQLVEDESFGTRRRFLGGWRRRWNRMARWQQWLFILIVLLRRIAHLGWAVALGLLTAGVTGNLIDRIFRPPSAFHGHVVDFIQLPHFAIFNVADMCVTSAAVLIVFLAIVKNISLGGERHPTRSEVAQQGKSDQGE